MVLFSAWSNLQYLGRGFHEYTLTREAHLSVFCFVFVDDPPILGQVSFGVQTNIGEADQGRSSCIYSKLVLWQLQDNTFLCAQAYIL